MKIKIEIIYFTSFRMISIKADNKHNFLKCIRNLTSTATRFNDILMQQAFI